MITAHYNLEIAQGANYEEFFNLKDSNGDPLNLTGYTANLQIRPYVSSDIVLLNASTENGLIFINGLLGRIELNFSSNDTDQLIYTDSVYDLFLTDPNGFKVKPLEGFVKVKRKVTRI